MNARSILYAMILGALIFLNGAVRLYVAIPPMPTASLTDEELDMMWAQLEVNKRTWEENQARLAVSNSAQTHFVPPSEEGLDASQGVGVTNTSLGGQVGDKSVPQSAGRVRQAESTGKEAADSTNSFPRPEQAEEDARRDLQLGSPKYFQIGLPIQHGRIWQELLRREHGIRLDLLGCTPVPPIAEYARSYNAVVLPVFQKEYGADFLNSSEAKAKKEFARSQMEQNKAGSLPAGAKLEFRIAPKASDLDNAEMAGYMDWLRAGKVGFWQNRPINGRYEAIAGQIPQYVWLPASGELSKAAQLVAGEYNGQLYVLVSDKPGQMMAGPPPQEPGATAKLVDVNPWGVAKVYATRDSNGRPAVGFELNQRGGELFSTLTKANIDRTLAIVVVGKVVSEPVIKTALGKTGMITDKFTAQEVNDLVESIRGGR